jgi:hypothetical protein
MAKECVGCGKDVPGPENENESGDWCVFGDCEIVDFDGVNRLRVAVAKLIGPRGERPVA